ncbi:TonB-dependent receptor [Aquabacterium sp.]|uniref:TonB-dependent receptor n=1 Tax=Aquabacterium sp. TaxID=1872578 RepID=UPI002C336228|nr:TonB-dependent receptor [Aquabacterium sp.]HSW06694.1 TonB-dependent receptor [Aquabacterium sp.]
MSAISGGEAEARRLSNFVDVVDITPGPTFVPVKGSATSSVQIRGRSSTNDATTLQNPVGIYIDDIYYGSLASFDSDFFDVQQIAVLRGPQGTTFGRNAVGGAVQITSNVARLGESSGQFSLTALKFHGGERGVESTGYANMPLGEKAAARIAYSVKDVGGYQRNLVTGHYVSDNKINSLKGSVTYAPATDLTITGLASYSRRNNKGDGARIVGMGWVAAAEAAASSNFHDVMIDDEGRVEREITSGLLKVEKKTTLGTFSTLLGYRHLNASFIEDSDGGPMPVNFPSVNLNRETQYSLEFRLVSPSNQQFEYVTGLYIGKEDLFHSILFNFDGRLPNTRLATFTGGTLQTQLVSGSGKAISAGPYFEGKWKFNEQWALTGGLRYVYDNKKGSTEHVGTSAFYGGPYLANLQSTTWTAWTPRAILEFKPAKDLLFYGSVSSGYQGGGWVLTAPNLAKATTPLEPEKTRSYELGTKSSFFNGAFTTNAALYQANTKNLQVRSLVNAVLTDTNAGEAEVKGLELELALRPARGLALGLNYAYTDAKFKTFPGCAAGNFNCTGKQLPFTPKNDVTLFADWTMRVGDGASLSWHADTKFADAYQLVATNAQQIAVPYTKRRGVTNASVTYAQDAANWDVRLWARNLTNRTYATNGLNYYFYNMTVAEAVAAGASADSERLSIAAPRSVGVTFTYHF